MTKPKNWASELGHTVGRLTAENRMLRWLLILARIRALQARGIRAVQLGGHETITIADILERMPHATSEELHQFDAALASSEAES